MNESRDEQVGRARRVQQGPAIEGRQGDAAPTRVPGKATATSDRPFAHPAAASANAIRSALGAAARTTATTHALRGAIDAADYLESARLSFEIRSGLQRAERGLAELERGDPLQAAELAAQVVGARESLAAAGREVAPLLCVAPRIEDATEASEAAWTARARASASASEAAPALDAGRWASDAAAMAGQLGLGTVDVRCGDDARAITDANGARGVALAGVVYLHPERARAGTPEGREVLAHEIVHLAQARLPGGAGDGRDAAEREAVALAPTLARGGAIAAPRHAIDLSTAAADDHGARLPDAPTRYGIHHTLGTVTKGPVTVSANIQAYVKDGDTITVKQTENTKLRVSLANQEALLRSKGDELTAQIATSVAKVEEIWNLDELSPLPGQIDLNLKVETKLFDAAFSADKVSLDLARIALVGEADITKLVLGGQDAALAASTTIKLVVRVEVRFPAEIVADLYRLHRAKSEVEIAGRAKRQLVDAKHALAKAEKKAARAAGRLGRAGRAAEELTVARSRLSRAKAVWSKARELTARAAETIGKVGGRLAKTAAGRAASKLALGAMKLIPGLNLLMAAQDLIEIGHKVKALLEGNAEFRLGGGEGGGAEHGADEPGDGEGTAEIDQDSADGDGDADGNGVASEGGDPASADAGGDGTGADGTGVTADGKGGTVSEPELTIADLAPPAHHAAATQILRAMEVESGESGNPLAPEDGAVLDEVIPADLDPGEIAEVIAFVQGKTGGEESDLVSAVVAAMEYVRPNGERRRPRMGADPAQATERPAATRAPQVHHRRRPARAGAAKSGEPVYIDPVPLLRAKSAYVYGADLTLPEVIKTAEFEATVERISGVPVMSSDDHEYVDVRVRLRITGRSTPDVYLGTKNAGQRIEVGRAYEVSFTVTATPQGEHSGTP